MSFEKRRGRFIQHKEYQCPTAVVAGLGAQAENGKSVPFLGVVEKMAPFENCWM